MLIELQKRKCLRCGHVFNNALGGVIFTPSPKCPLCGYHFTIKLRAGSTINVKRRAAYHGVVLELSRHRRSCFATAKNEQCLCIVTERQHQKRP